MRLRQINCTDVLIASVFVFVLMIFASYEAVVIMVHLPYTKNFGG